MERMMCQVCREHRMRNLRQLLKHIRKAHDGDFVAIAVLETRTKAGEPLNDNDRNLLQNYLRKEQ